MSFVEQIMSKDKYTEVAVGLLSFKNLWDVLKTGEYHSDIQLRDTFKPIGHEQKYLIDFKNLHIIQVYYMATIVGAL